MNVMKNQRGFAMIDALMAIIVMAIIIPVVLSFIQRSNDATIRNAAANHATVVSSGLERYVESQYAAIIAGGATATTAVQVTFAQLSAQGLIPPTLTNVNPYGQTYVGYVLQPTPGNLQAILLTTGGRPLDPAHPEYENAEIPGTAALLGAKGGYIPTGLIPTQLVTTAVGAFGGWVFDFTGTNIPNPGPSHLAIMSYFEQGMLDSQYLHRQQVPGAPQLNQMQTDIDMNGSSINNAFDVNATNNVNAGNAVNANQSLTVSTGATQTTMNAGSFGPTQTLDMTVPGGLQVRDAVGPAEVISSALIDGDNSAFQADPSGTSVLNNLRIRSDQVVLPDKANATLDDLLPRYSQTGAYLVQHNTQVIKPTCATGGTPKIIVSPAIVTSRVRTGGAYVAHTSYTARAFSISPTRWRVSLTTQYGAATQASPGSRALANVFCMY